MIRTGLLWSGALIALALGISLWGWSVLPEGTRMPVHWGLDGRPDRYGSRFEGLLAIPLVMAAVTALLAFLSRVPGAKRIEEARLFYLTAWIGSMLISLLAHLFIVLTATGTAEPPVGLIVGAVGLFLAAVGNYTAKSRPNSIAGLRTRATMASDDAWIAGNRALGRAMVVSGLLAALAGFAGWLAVATAVLLLGTVAGLVAGTVAARRVAARET